MRRGSVDREAAVPPEGDQLGDLLAGEQLDGAEAELGGVVLAAAITIAEAIPCRWKSGWTETR